jgi:hypothetical protein
MLSKFAVVLFAISMSIGTANAKVAHKHYPFCTDGMVKATCVCSMATSGRFHALCKPGQWCHTWKGACHD